MNTELRSAFGPSVAQAGSPWGEVVDISGPSHSRFPEFAALYAREFQHDTTAESIEFFRGSRDVVGLPFPYRYRLWGIAQEERSPVAGFASFYSLPRCGFGGYLALCGELRGKGLLRVLIRQMEEFMVQSNPETHGWYVECEPASTEATIVKRCGFIQVPIHYLQPQLVSDTTGISDAAPLELLYKPIREDHQQPHLTTGELKHNLTQIMWACYRMDSNAAQRRMERMTFTGEDNVDVFAGV